MGKSVSALQLCAPYYNYAVGLKTQLIKIKDYQEDAEQVKLKWPNVENSICQESKGREKSIAAFFVIEDKGQKLFCVVYLDNYILSVTNLIQEARTKIYTDFTTYWFSLAV